MQFGSIYRRRSLGDQHVWLIKYGQTYNARWLCLCLPGSTDRANIADAHWLRMIPGETVNASIRSSRHGQRQPSTDRQTWYISSTILKSLKRTRHRPHINRSVGEFDHPIEIFISLFGKDRNFMILRAFLQELFKLITESE